MGTAQRARRGAVREGRAGLAADGFAAASRLGHAQPAARPTVLGGRPVFRVGGARRFGCGGLRRGRRRAQPADRADSPDPGRDPRRAGAGTRRCGGRARRLGPRPWKSESRPRPGDDRGQRRERLSCRRPLRRWDPLLPTGAGDLPRTRPRPAGDLQHGHSGPALPGRRRPSDGPQLPGQRRGRAGRSVGPGRPGGPPNCRRTDRTAQCSTAVGDHAQGWRDRRRHRGPNRAGARQPAGQAATPVRAAVGRRGDRPEQVLGVDAPGARGRA